MNDFDRAVGGMGGVSTPTSFIPDEAQDLFQQLSDSHDTWAAGAALYAAGGHWDAHRKARLALYSAEIRDGYAEKGEKVTEARLDELSHAHPDYNEWLGTSTKERALWLGLDAQRAEWMMRLKFISYSPVR